MFLNGDEWEDAVIFLDMEKAINESIRYPNKRVEIFARNIDGSYTPTYNIYKNGEYIEIT